MTVFLRETVDHFLCPSEDRSSKVLSYRTVDLTSVGVNETHKDLSYLKTHMAPPGVLRHPPS